MEKQEPELTPEETTRQGPIGWMTRNRVAANLLMVIAIAGGIIGLSTAKREVFPTFDLDLITVSVAYPGASPREVEQGMLLAIEESIAGIDGVKRVTSVASEGVGTVSAELILSADPNIVLADMTVAVDRIRTFPEDAEEPVVSLASIQNEVISLVISGNQELNTLHEIAERVRARLIQHDDVTIVEIAGVPPLEVSIEVEGETLEALGLTLDEVARQIGAASVELPGGGLKTQSGELLLRLNDRRRLGFEFEDVIIRGTLDGDHLRLSDIASIRDGFADTDQASFFNGQPAVRLTAYRTGDETPERVAEVVYEELERLRSELGDTVDVTVWDDDAERLQAKLSLLTRNAAVGFFLVILVLALFLRPRLAFWVALGIPISFFGAFSLMPTADLTINIVTLDAFIVTLGLVVDDAIIVGEAIQTKAETGLSRMQAAIEGAREVALPVTFAVLTTVAAFSPLFFIPGVMGKIFWLFPAIILLVLVFSLLESFFILPAHLSHSKGKLERLVYWPGRLSDVLSQRLEWFIDRGYRPLLVGVLRNRFIVLACAIAALLAAIALVAGGRIPFGLFPKMEGEQVTASVRFPYGSPLERTNEARVQLETAAAKALEECGGPDILLGMYTRLGEGRGSKGAAAPVGSHLLTIELDLVKASERSKGTSEIAAAWERHTGDLSGVELLSFKYMRGPSAGSDVAVQLSHQDPDVLRRASEELAEVLRGFEQLTSVENGYSAGKPQLDYRLLPEATSVGLSGADVGRQLRSAFYGAEALREQRGRHELKVMVRLPESQRRSEYHIEQLLIRSPRGGHLPLSTVARLERGSAPTSIIREDGQRIVEVSAALAPGLVSSREIVASLSATTIPALEARYPGLTSQFVGREREQSEAFSNIGVSFALALVVIFGLLAIPLRSYSQPLIIMSVIPFGFVGAVTGHLIMGFELSLPSILGIVALSGVVVNDSLLMVHTTNGYQAAGLSLRDAVVRGGTRRLRPVLLTSLTTFFGLLPLMLDTSQEAKILVPMAISLGWGILFATFMVLLLVPALYTIVSDLRSLTFFGPSETTEGSAATGSGSTIE